MTQNYGNDTPRLYNRSRYDWVRRVYQTHMRRVYTRLYVVRPLTSARRVSSSTIDVANALSSDVDK